MIKIKNKKKFIKSLIVILVIIIAILSIFTIRKNVENQVIMKSSYTSMDDFTSPEEVLIYMGSKYINQKLDINEDCPYTIYAKFKYDLYTKEGESNEGYFGQIIHLIAHVLNYQNYKIIDEKNDITIEVMSDSENKSIQQIYINGDWNYYGNRESIKNLRNYTQTPKTEFTINSDLINKLIENDWEASSVNLNRYNEATNIYGDTIREYVKDELEVRIIGTKIYNIVFQNEKEKIINDLAVNTSLEEVVFTIGEPTFGSIEDGVVGYKNEEIYVFFSEKEVAVYKIDKAEGSEKLDELFEKYLEDRNVKELVSAITDIWNNYDLYYYDENVVDLQYMQKGVKVQYGVTQNHGITFYSNYIGKVMDNKTLLELSKEDSIKTGAFIFFSDKDLISEYEIERVKLENAIGDMIEDGSEEYLEE